MPDTCLVTGTVVDSTFSILPFQTVVFRPVGPPLVSAGGDLLVRTLASAVADASGSIAKNVVPGEYVLETMGSEGVVTASCLVPNAATAALADCVAAAGEVLTPDLVQQSLDARDAAQAFALAAEAARDLALAGSPYRLGSFSELASRVRYSGATGNQINAPLGAVFQVAGLPEAFVVIASGATGAALDYTAAGGVKFSRASDVWYYVHSSTGNDAKSGLSPTTPKQSLGALPRMDGLRLRLMAGSSWRESLDLSAFRDTAVEGYGDFVAAGGVFPLVRGDDIIPGPWQDSAARGDAYGTVYSVSWTHSIIIGDRNLVPWVFEDDADMVMAPDLATCASTPGTFWHAQPSTGVVVEVFVHPTGSTNPATNGRTYSATRRHEVVRVGDDFAIRNLWGHAAGNTLGAIVHGDRGLLENVLSSGCPLHAINGGPNVVRRRVVGICATKPPADNPLVIEIFAPDLKQGIAVHEHCYAIGPASLGSTDVVGFGGHTTAGGRGLLRVEYHDCAAVHCTMDSGDAQTAVYRRCALWNGSILAGLRSDGGPCTLDIEDLMAISATKAGRGYVVQTAQMSPTGDMAETRITGMRCYFNFNGSTDAIFVQPGNLTLSHSTIFLAPGSVGSDGLMRMDSASSRMRAALSNNIIVGQVGGLFLDLRNSHLNGSSFASDCNVLSPLVSNNTNSGGYRSQVGGTMTTRYTLTDIRASFGVELNSVNTDPQLIDPAAGDFRPRTALAIHSVGPERPGVRFPKRLNNRAEALKWLIYGEVV